MQAGASLSSSLFQRYVEVDLFREKHWCVNNGHVDTTVQNYKPKSNRKYTNLKKKKQNTNCVSFNLAFGFNNNANKQPNMHVVSEVYFMSFYSQC